MLQACGQKNTPNELMAFLPEPMELSEDCVWKTKELDVLEDSDSVVSFRYANCGHDEGTNFNVSKNGTWVKKGFYDVVYDNFHIFERTDEPIETFIKNLPNDNYIPGENCEPRQISKKYWMFDNGLVLDAEIYKIPCGRYGRNYAGQTVFEIKDDIILNYNLRRNEDGIDPSSIVLKRRSTP